MYLTERTGNLPALTAVWRAYACARRAVDDLESIGLAVDGGNKDPGRLSVLYGAMTAAEDAMAAVAGISEEKAKEVLHAVMSEEADRADDPYGDLPKAVASYLDLARDKAFLLAGADDRPYEVTVAMAGSLAIRAGSPEQATALARELPAGQLVRLADWCAPEATDAAEAGGGA